jgi:hypothetical protein
MIMVSAFYELQWFTHIAMVNLLRHIVDGFVKRSRYGMRIPRKEAYLSYAAVTRDTRNADIGRFTKPSFAEHRCA